MAKGCEIVVSACPRGVMVEGLAGSAFLPGSLIEIDPAAGFDDSGRPTWRLAQPGADGERKMIAVARPDEFQGKTNDIAYAVGERCFGYIPAMGEELNVLVADAAGAFGDVMMLQDSTGQIIATAGTPESEPFQLLETITAAGLTHVLYTGV